MKYYLWEGPAMDRTKFRLFHFIIFYLLMTTQTLWSFPAEPGTVYQVRVYEGTVEIPAYEFSGREIQPPLFRNSSVEGKYPFLPYRRPFKPGGPRPRTYQAIFLENEYLKLTYLPEFGGRVYSLYDKVAGREVFYANDVIKPAGYNMKDCFPLFGIELTGPYDSHAITLNNEPLWFNKVLRHEDGSAELVMSNIDPVYRMKVNFSARLYPGVAAMQMKVFCYNRRDSRHPYMFWISGSVRSTEKTRFIYPMTRTIGHTTSEVADWPFYGEVDYSWDRNNKHMLGVFGIDIYDDFQGAYDFNHDRGVFRFADRRVVQGMKMWTFGYSNRASNLERVYTDKGGPYIEVQSGRYVWDGWYEWLAPQKHESWSEWWLPVSGIGGLTTTTSKLALNLDVAPDPECRNSSLELSLWPSSRFPGSRVLVTASCGELFGATADLAPDKPFNEHISGIAADSSGLAGMVVTVTDSSGQVLLSYRRPDDNPGRKEYTSFTRGLEKSRKATENMTAEELVLEARNGLRQLKSSSAIPLLERALTKDENFTVAHQVLGILHYSEHRPDSAAAHLEKAVERDPYIEESHYFLALSRLELGDTLNAERCLYYIPTSGAYYSQREYLLGRLAFLRGQLVGATEHLREAVMANGYLCNARCLLALIYRLLDKPRLAEEQLERVEKIDPTNRWALAERLFLTGDEQTRKELLRLLGSQSQEALELSHDYSQLGRWQEALKVLRLVENDPHDPWGRVSLYYYTLAFYLEQLNHRAEAAKYRSLAQECASNVDRYPFRPESVAPLAAAIRADPGDAPAHFYLGCLLYHLGKQELAVSHWEKAVEADSEGFSQRRALGLAYAEQNYGVDKAVAQLEKAVLLNPKHIPTFNDLSLLYARAGRFQDQLALLEKTLARSPSDDNLVENIIEAHIRIGNYLEAQRLIDSHKFNPRHRKYSLRRTYRFMRYGMGARAFNRFEYEKALKQFQLALTPPVNLGVDDFQFQAAPRAYYYIGRALEALGKIEEAREAYRNSAYGWEYLSGDRDSWNSENFFMVLSLEKLGLEKEAKKLLTGMENFARSQLENRHRYYRAQARYLLALVEKKQGNYYEARSLLEESLRLEPDALGPRLVLRGHLLDPLPEIH